MIPLHISLEGFLSYREKQTFSFADAPLWVLSGPNGAGKSAVFDGITFALFGRYARHRTEDFYAEDLIHHDADVLVVEFDFELDKQVYRIRRTASRQGRPTFSLCHLIPTENGGEPLIDSLEESQRGLNNWVKREIGLDYEAFTQSLLLMQGESETLLKAIPSERYKLLAKLMNLSRYQRLYQLAEEQRKQHEWRAEERSRQLQNVPLVSDEDFLAAQQVVTNAEAELLVAQKRVDLLESLLPQAWQWEQLTAEIRQQQARAQEASVLIEREKEIETGHSRLRELDDVLPILNQIIIGRSRLDEGSQQLEQIAQQRAHASAELVAAQEAWREVEADAERIENELSELQHRRVEIMRLAEELLPLLHKFEQWEQAQADCTKLTQQMAGLPTDLPQLLEAAEARARQLDEIKQALPWLGQFAEHRTELAEIFACGDQVREQLTYIEAQLREQTAQRDKLSQELQVAQERKRACELDANTKRTIYDQICKQRNRFMTAAQQATCDYCGQSISEEHKRDHLARLAEEVSIAEAQLQATELDYQQVATELLRLEEVFAEQAQRITQLNNEYRKGETERDELRSEYKGYLTKLQTAFAQLPTVWQQLICGRQVDDKVDWLRTSYPSEADLQRWQQETAQSREQDELLQELNSRRQEWQQLHIRLQATQEREASLRLNGQFDRAQSARSEKARLDQQRVELEEQIRQYEAGRTSARQKDKQLREQVEACRQELYRLDAESQSVQARQSEMIGQLHAKVESLPLDWQEQAANHQEADLQAFQAERGTLACYESLRRELEMARQALAHSEQRLHELQNEIAKFLPEAQRPGREVEAALTEARRQRDLASAQYHQSQATCSKLEEQRQARDRLEKEHKEAEHFRGLYKLLAELLGREGLQLCLLRQAERAIVNHANEILDGLSRGQLRLALRGEEVDGGQTIAFSEKALDLEVYNQAVSTKPIPVFQTSGSQRFRLAVSLALAIGRYASEGGRVLESVIIDEGFGSLDQNGRDDMVQELHRLQQQLAKILIVSHQEDFARAFGNGYTVRLVDGASQVELLPQI